MLGALTFSFEPSEYMFLTCCIVCVTRAGLWELGAWKARKIAGNTDNTSMVA